MKKRDRQVMSINNVEIVKYDNAHYKKYWAKKEKLKSKNDIHCACSVYDGRKLKYTEKERKRFKRYISQLSDEIFDIKGPFQKFMFALEEHNQLDDYQIGLAPHANYGQTSNS